MNFEEIFQFAAKDPGSRIITTHNVEANINLHEKNKKDTVARDNNRSIKSSR